MLGIRLGTISALPKLGVATPQGVAEKNWVSRRVDNLEIVTVNPSK
jgi:hypothetical protein